MTLCFTGHRPNGLPWGDDESHPSHLRMLEMISDEICARVEQGYGHFICGAAMGTDIEFGEQVLRLRKQRFPHIALTCAIPFPNQARSWPEDWQRRYCALLEAADEKALIAERFARGCYHKRNRYMVDSADTVLAIWNGTAEGGTAYTVQYAMKHGKTVVCFDPVGLTRSILSPP